MASGRLSIFGWTPGIGDPTPLGWLTVAAYFITFALCLFAWWKAGRAPTGAGGREARFWLCLAIIYGLLGINKELDLQTLLTVLMRHEAQVTGWYEARRSFEIAFVLGLVALSILCLKATFAWLRDCGRPVKLAGLGLTFTVAFVCYRAASFHHFDPLLAVRLGGVRLNGVFELGGMVPVMLSAIFYGTGRRPNAAGQKPA